MALEASGSTREKMAACPDATFSVRQPEEFDAKIDHMIESNGGMKYERLQNILGEYIRNHTNRVNKKYFKNQQTDDIYRYNPTEVMDLVKVFKPTRAEQERLQQEKERREAEAVRKKTEAELTKLEHERRRHEEEQARLAREKAEREAREAQERLAREAAERQARAKQEELARDEVARTQVPKIEQPAVLPQRNTPPPIKVETKEENTESPYKKLIEKVTEPIIRWDRTQNKVALTFDDGYYHVEEILDLLKEKNVKTTFFITGDNVVKRADLWQRAIAEGHQICNHTMDHHASTSPLARDPKDLERQILEREKICETTFGKAYLLRMKRDFPFFRFPGGWGGGWAEKQDLLQVLKNHGYLPIGRTYTDPFVGEGEAEERMKKSVNNGKPPANGAISLHHFDEGGLEIARRYLEEIAWKKQAVTLSELMPPASYTTPIGWRTP